MRWVEVFDRPGSWRSHKPGYRMRGVSHRQRSPAPAQDRANHSHSRRLHPPQHRLGPGPKTRVAAQYLSADEEPGGHHVFLSVQVEKGDAGDQARQFLAPTLISMAQSEGERYRIVAHWTAAPLPTLREPIGIPVCISNCALQRSSPVH